MDQTTLFDTSNNDAEEHIVLGHFAERAYLDYAISVVKGRALPDVADGQKPVQRRILYAMHAMGLSATSKPVKSARVVGDVLGKFHPHGDQAAYDALVRMAQDFSLRYPLIDGQGNFGSRDGDGAAAMRYTEARLTPIAKLLLDEIDQGTVDFRPNYDGAFEEPNLLPARLPFALLNGASGIAVGMATEILPHNLTEIAQACVAVLRQPKISDAEITAIIPGPDFPGGAQIISSTQEIAEIYKIGRGSLKVRARWKIEDLARGQWQLIVTELPPNTSAQKVLEEIEDLTNPKIKLGKKTLTAEQLQLKQQMLALLDTVRDESGKEAVVRLVFAPKSKNIDVTEFTNTLLAHTSLESSASLNLVSIGRDGRPQQKSLRSMLCEWADFRIETVTRRSRHRLGKVQERIHILEGRLQILLNIDQVIRIIRESDEPKPALIAHFKLSERQAEDILEIRLRQLARLEGIRIEQELAELHIEQDKLQTLLGSDSALRKQIIKEVEQDAKTFGDTRRTLIEVAQKAVVETKLIDEPVTVVISANGWVRARTGHGHIAGQFTFKAGDALYATFECRTVDTLLAFGSNGRVYSVGVAQLPGARGDGVPITTLIDLEVGSKIVHYFAAAAQVNLLIAQSGGYGFSSTVGEMTSRIKAGKQFITLANNEILLRPYAIENHTAIACLSSSGRLLLFDVNELKQLSGGGRGVILQTLEVQEYVLSALPIHESGLTVVGTARGGKPYQENLSGRQLVEYAAKRARKGKVLDVKGKPNGLISLQKVE